MSLRRFVRHTVTVLVVALATVVATSTPSQAWHTDPGNPSPNGTSPWLYSEAWFISGSWYGEGYHTEANSDYYAIDFAYAGAPCRRNLYAYWDGMTVSYVNTTSGSLYMTKTIDGWQYRVKYLHMDEIWYGVGATVGTNTVVGLSGTKGNSTGCHLHLSVHRYHPEDGWWHAIEPKFCGRTYPHDHSTNFAGC